MLLKRRISILLLALSLMAGLVTASAGEPQRPTITIGLQQSINVEDYETNSFTLLLEKEMDMNLEFVILPADGNDARSKLSMMVSSNSKLPDVLAMELSSTLAYDYAQKGVFVKLTDYFDDTEMSANFWAIPDEDREIMIATARLADGELYCVPGYNPFTWNMGPYRMWVNNDWLQKLGLEMPHTLDAFTEVARAFATQDPNGNGKADEIAIVGSKDGWAQKPFAYIMNAFTYANPDKQYFAVEDGKIVPAFTKEEWLQGLEYMKALVDEGLFSPLSFTQDGAQLKALIGVENGMAGFVASGSGSTFTALPETQAAFVLAPPLEGPAGNVSTPCNPSTARLQWWITKDASDVELAYRLGELMYRIDIANAARYGEEGVDWSTDPEVTINWMGENEQAMGLTTRLAMVNNIWNTPQNKMWGVDFIGYRSNLDSMSVGAYEKSNPPADLSGNKIRSDYHAYYVPAFPKELILSINYTTDEIEAVANAKTAIDAYVYDTAVAFITGNRPLSSWNEYLAELDNMGLAEYVAVTQAAYDRAQ